MTKLTIWANGLREECVVPVGGKWELEEPRHTVHVLTAEGNLHAWFANVASVRVRDEVIA